MEMETNLFLNAKRGTVRVRDRPVKEKLWRLGMDHQRRGNPEDCRRDKPQRIC